MFPKKVFTFKNARHLNLNSVSCDIDRAQRSPKIAQKRCILFFCMFKLFERLKDRKKYSFKFESKKLKKLEFSKEKFCSLA